MPLLLYPSSMAPYLGFLCPWEEMTPFAIRPSYNT